MNKQIFSLVFFAAFLAPHFSFAGILSAKDIMTKNEDARHVTEFVTDAKITTGTVGAAGDKFKDFTLWRKVQGDGVHNNTLTRFHAPAEVRDEGILIIENGSGKNDVLLYLPAFKKIRRVESQQQSGSFMGSVFSYSDIATPHVADYEYKMLKEEKCPTAEAAAQNCTVIECIPANDDVKDRTGYSKSVIWVRNDNFMGVKADYYDVDGNLFKKMEANQIKIVDAKNQKWLAHSIYLQNIKSNEFTKLEFSNVKVNSGIADSIFTQQNLQKVK
jgi:outer membrane lipoprotein-sorting protein